MFQIIADIIYYDRQPVAVFRQDVIPTVRETVEDYLQGHNPDEEPEECGECDSLANQIDELEKAHENNLSDLETRLEDQIIELRSQRDSYAALLGIKP